MVLYKAYLNNGYVLRLPIWPFLFSDKESVQLVLYMAISLDLTICTTLATNNVWLHL